MTPEQALREASQLERLPFDYEDMIVGTGWLRGNMIRKARKRHRCDYGLGLANRCQRMIEPGDFYVEGDPNDRAGYYGNDRYCLDCVARSYNDA